MMNNVMVPALYFVKAFCSKVTCIHLQRWCSRARRHCGNKVQGKGSAEDDAQDRHIVDAEQGPTQR